MSNILSNISVSVQNHRNGISNYEGEVLRFLDKKPVRFNLDKLERPDCRHSSILYGEGVLEWLDKSSKNLLIRWYLGIFWPDSTGEWRTKELREAVSFIANDITRDGENFGMAGSEFCTSRGWRILSRNTIDGDIITWLSDLDIRFLASIRYKKRHSKPISDGEKKRLQEIFHQQKTTLAKEVGKIYSFAEAMEKVMTTKSYRG